MYRESRLLFLRTQQYYRNRAILTLGHAGMIQEAVNDASTRVLAWLLRELVQVTYKNIGLADVNRDKSDDGEFLSRTKEVLDLIERVDPRRFRRVQDQIRYIVNVELTSTGEYWRGNKLCPVDFGRLRLLKNPEWSLHFYAGLIVHEATHGMLYSKGIPYTRDSRERVERLCQLEAKRFMMCARPEWADQMFGEFNASDWSLSWYGSRWKRWRFLMKRIGESKRSANKPLNGTT
jgi:hypothetical protein